MGSPGVDGGATMAEAFRKQIGWCESLDAPFTARLLTLLAADLGRGGAVAALVGDWPGDPVADAVPLRLAGALHALALGGTAPALAACYPPNEASAEQLAAAVAEALAGSAGFVRGFIASPPQTNEVGRSAVLLGGFLQVAETTGLPLRLLEIGASAGLNLHWDRYRYRLGSADWGDPASAVRLLPDWSGPLPPMAAPLRAVARAGCDVAPIDLEVAENRSRLRAYVWADQPDRLARLDAAIAVARAAGGGVERADAADWVAGQLAQAAPNQATVLYHSIMWQYMPGPTQAAIRQTLDRAGAAATDAAPLAWLRFEPPRPESRPELVLTEWPGGHERRLATAHPHGRSVHWL